jgi:ketosteroid isomerase-like protein
MSQNEPSIPQVIIDYMDASNAHDVEAYMNTLTADLL